MELVKEKGKYTQPQLVLKKRAFYNIILIKNGFAILNSC